MVRNSLRGQHAPPFTRRREPEVASGADLLSPRALRVAAVVRETSDCVSLVLEDPTGAPVRFVAGQFFTVVATIDGEPLRRAYSASSSALDSARVSITAKRVAGGKMSTWLNAQVSPGDMVSVLGPSGSFIVEPKSDQARHLVLIGGGSGITPLIAIARAVLAIEPRSRVALVYANRTDADVIFESALLALEREHEGRLLVRHVTGLLDRAAAAREIDVTLAVMVDATLVTDFYVCGPEGMMTEVRAELLSRAVRPERIHEERFASPHLRARVASTSCEDSVGSPHALTIHANGVAHRVLVAGGLTVLEAGIAAGVAMPFSCAMGGCGACKVKLRGGEVDMEEPSCLTTEERAAGYVLACVARPKGGADLSVEIESS
jgi:ring-1,2-phenylacetyl-CoA epoxidase subunit PaaE